jgi:hypothetical protein
MNVGGGSESPGSLTMACTRPVQERQVTPLAVLLEYWSYLQSNKFRTYSLTKRKESQQVDPTLLPHVITYFKSSTKLAKQLAVSPLVSLYERGNASSLAEPSLSIKISLVRTSD